MAAFDQRDSGWWQAKIRRKGWPVQSKTFRTKVDAEAWARSVEAEMDRGLFRSTNEAERTTMSDLIDRFTKEFALKHYRVRDDKKEAWRFQCAILKEILGAHSLAAIDQKAVTKYRDDRIAGLVGRKAVGESTVRKELYMLSKLLGFAEAECEITLPRGNPVAKIRKPLDSKPRERRLTVDEWTRLENECRNSRNLFLWPAVELALETAMRQGEMLGLEWDKVDMIRHIALVQETKNGDARMIPLTPRAVTVLKELKTKETGRVLPVERLTLYHAFIAACKRAGIRDYSWHDTRHEALSRLGDRGDMNVLELSAVSGHRTLQMLKRYTHLHAETLAKKLARPPI